MSERLVLSLLVLLCLATPARGQETQAPEPSAYKQSLFIELGGNALFYSLNYDRMIEERLAARIGVGALSVDDNWVGEYDAYTGDEDEEEEDLEDAAEEGGRAPSPQVTAARRELERRLAARIGVGALSVDDNWVVSIPLTLGYILGQGNSRMEVGGGVTILTGDIDFDDDISEETYVLGTAVFAYRYQRPESVFFRFAFTPVFTSGGFFPWFGISIGSSV